LISACRNYNAITSDLKTIDTIIPNLSTLYCIGLHALMFIALPVLVFKKKKELLDLKKNSEVQKMAGAENFSRLDRFAENDQSKGMFGTAPVNSSSIFSGAGAQPKQFQLHLKWDRS
jgi:hypothetical protein